MSRVVIKGIELEEVEEFEANLERLLTALEARLSFNTTYEWVVQSLTKKGKRADVFLRISLFIALIPQYITYLLGGGKRAHQLREAEDLLFEHYQLPETKVRRFRLQCTREKLWYDRELKVVENEIGEQEENLQSTSIGNQTRQEIMHLLEQYRLNRGRKRKKYSFYQGCEERLMDIEEQFAIKKSILNSKDKLRELNEGAEEERRTREIEEEFQIFDYYGDVLKELSADFKKMEEDKEEEIEELELKEILLRIENINLK